MAVFNWTPLFEKDAKALLDTAKIIPEPCDDYIAILRAFERGDVTEDQANRFFDLWYSMVMWGDDMLQLLTLPSMTHHVHCIPMTEKVDDYLSMFIILSQLGKWKVVASVWKENINTQWKSMDQHIMYLDKKRDDIQKELGSIFRTDMTLADMMG